MAVAPATPGPAAPPPPVKPAERVLRELSPTDPVYAVLDCARNRIVYPWIISTRAPAWCLYRGEIPSELASVAPYLVRLGRGHDYTDRFFSEGWGDAWGVVFSSPASSKELRRHLRKFLKMATEDHRTLVFRWYDPRVLRAYLPTCTPEERAAFFGPITAFAVEAQEPGAFHVFTLSGERLVR